mgnify:CR=1 FL=1
MENKKKKRIVIALGGNALGNTLPEQMKAVKITAKAIVDLIEEGCEVIVAHGNGPQVGMINNAMAALSREDANQPNTPLSVCVAMSQAYINNCLSEWDSSLDCNAKEILHKALFSASEAGDIRFIRYEEVDSSYDPERDIVQKKDAFLLKGSLLKSLLHEYAPGYSAYLKFLKNYS